MRACHGLVYQRVHIQLEQIMRSGRLMIFSSRYQEGVSPTFFRPLRLGFHHAFPKDPYTYLISALLTALLMVGGGGFVYSREEDSFSPSFLLALIF